MTIKNDSARHVNNSPIVLSPDDTLFSTIVHLVQGANRIVLTAIDKAGNSDSTIVSLVYKEPKVTARVDQKGGTVTSPDGASVNVPAHALLGGIDVTIVPVAPIEQRQPLNKSVTLLNVAHNFGPDGTVFRKPVQITLPYTDRDLDTNQDGTTDIDPARCIIMYWDGSAWQMAGPTTIDT